MYLVMKRGLYYRPDSRGYTANVSEAGRYTLQDAIKEKAQDPKAISILCDRQKSTKLRVV